MARSTQREKIALHVVKGGFVPADEGTLTTLKRTRLKTGDLVLADIDTPRNPAYYRMAHKFAQVCRENIEDFRDLTEHQVLKRLQAYTGIACEPVTMPATVFWSQVSDIVRETMGSEAENALAGIGSLLEGRTVIAYLPRSLAFGEMPESEFKATFEAFCEYVAERYWPGMSRQEVAQFAGFMSDA